MKQAGLLTTTFRQLASAKLGAKGGLDGALHSKDGKEKAEHFREQMRRVSKDQSPAIPKINKAAAHASTAAASALEVAAVLAELTSDIKPKPIDKDQPEKDEDIPRASGDGRQATGGINEWGDPNIALTAVMSKLGHPQQNSDRNDKSMPASLVPGLNAKTGQGSSDPTDAINTANIDVTDVDVPIAKKFTAAIETVDTKSALISKPVVREQETHFEPVQQVTTLQKIVDRMASDLPTVASPENAHTAEPPQDAAKSAESRPVRMMTLELDPPNLGTVTIKMRLAGDSVEVHLMADRLETTNLLRQERGALSDAMQSAGYSFDIAAIDHTRTPDANLNNGQSQSQPQQQQGSSDQRGSMSSSNGSQTNDGSSGRSSGEGQNGARQNRQDNDQSQPSADRQQDQGNRRIRSSTVYL